MPQQFAQAGGSQQERPQDAAQENQGGQTRSDVEFDALDAVLDDIESTLETNAEEYVKSFVQKGGE
ncbi:ubiquitin-like protein Pup [Bifidobacterium platyrrhinorum]|uniref:Prokaryotic ubiquitin-like protein Pup n=1 Tax=Bifidobacterium platyrrhinorum TaxID=2661628 RepID=A0A6L9SQI5_9BIFI|nr:ubiquitin-like protein Pup [Bifidobacterium platyrrhinorum]NEG54249.1 ubiquitin-like protein Pup [Bifidobacterium platyrrhinorum]